MSAVAPAPEIPRERFRAGVRAGAPYGAAGLLLSLSFGILAVDVGMPGWAAVLMSLVVFAGSAQFASISIVGAGGGVGAAVAAAAMANARFLPMGVAFAPSLPGPTLWRVLQGQTVVDSSWAMAARGDGSFDRHFLFGSTAIQYVTWATGTALGAFGGDLLPPAEDMGLDAIFPTFFLAILLGEIAQSAKNRGEAGAGERIGSDREAAGVALAGGALALALVEVTPVGIPVLLAGVVALWGARRREAAA